MTDRRFVCGIRFECDPVQLCSEWPRVTVMLVLAYAVDDRSADRRQGPEARGQST